MYSMTGFGRGEYKNGGIELTVEIKTVNNRYLDVSVKCPRIFSAQEDNIRTSLPAGMRIYLYPFPTSANAKRLCALTKPARKPMFRRRSALNSCSRRLRTIFR